MKTKVCAVACCRKDSIKYPGLTFFSLPRDPNAKSEWLEALNLKYRDASPTIKVCPDHFRAKDFCAGRRQLKTHAVPVLHLGVSKIEPLDSDDEFVMCDLEDGVLKEVKKESNTIKTPMDGKIKQEPVEKPPEEQEQETGRRPSRRAAREAAKRIYNTVRNYGCTAETDDPEVIGSSAQRLSNTPRPTSNTPRQRQRQRSYQNIKVPPPDIGLAMECHEELLSTVQAEALLQAQIEYNMVMKYLRSLKTMKNVRIIVEPPPAPVIVESDDETHIPDDPPMDYSSDCDETDISEETSKKEKETVIPIKLSAHVPSPAQSILS